MMPRMLPRRPAGTRLALIYPNPLNPNRYVVFNSGHTFPGELFDDMHWYLHPRLADYAVVETKTGRALSAGFFDAHWQPPPAR